MAGVPAAAVPAVVGAGAGTATTAATLTAAQVTATQLAAAQAAAQFATAAQLAGMGTAASTAATTSQVGAMLAAQGGSSGLNAYIAQQAAVGGAGGIMGPIAQTAPANMSGVMGPIAQPATPANIHQGVMGPIAEVPGQTTAGKSLLDILGLGEKSSAVSKAGKGLQALQLLGKSSQDAATREHQARTEALNAGQAGLKARGEVVAMQRQSTLERTEMRAQQAARGGLGGSYETARAQSRSDAEYGMSNAALSGAYSVAGRRDNANLYSHSAGNIRTQGVYSAIDSLFRRRNARGEIV